MGRDRQAFARWVQRQVLAHLQAVHGDVKPAVLRRAAGRVGRLILANPLTCWDPLHTGGVRAAMAVEERLHERLGPLADLACEQLFHGHVVPVQRVLALIDEAEAAALGRCVCRAAPVVADLVDGDDPCAGAEDDLVAARLDEVLTAWAPLRGAAAAGEPTGAPLRAALEAAWRAADRTPRERLGALFRDTYPNWEILLTHRAITPEWRKNLFRAGKAWPIDRRVLRALVRSWYDVRGAVFTRMEAVDDPYALCTCPGPERDGGCSLVHWYYHSQLDGALYPNTDDGFGQARDVDGRVLPCQRHAARSTRPCLGCGCEHG